MADLKMVFMKLVPIAISPVAFVFFLLLLGSCLLVRARRWFELGIFGTALLFLLVAGNPWVSDSLLRTLEEDFSAVPISVIESADAIVVLGGGLESAMPPRTSALNDAADRLLFGFRLYRAGKAPRVILTGSAPFGTDLAPSASAESALLLEEWGVPASALIVHHGARNTYQESLAVREIVRERNFQQLILVTSAFHMPRAVAVFRSRGLKITPAPTDYRSFLSGQPFILNLIPSPEALFDTSLVLKEYAGMLGYRLAGYIE